MKIKINNMYVEYIILDVKESTNNFICELKLSTYEYGLYDNANDIANKLREIGFNCEVEEEVETLE